MTVIKRSPVAFVTAFEKYFLVQGYKCEGLELTLTLVTAAITSGDDSYWALALQLIVGVIAWYTASQA